jgi:hypothetical protein
MGECRVGRIGCYSCAAGRLSNDSRFNAADDPAACTNAYATTSPSFSSDPTCFYTACSTINFGRDA